MKVLGLSFHYHDAAAALVVNGRIVGAAAEERFSRKKHDLGFPREAAAWCLEEGRLLAKDLDLVVFYEKPWRKFERILLSHLAGFPRSFAAFRKALPVWVTEKLWVPYVIENELGYRGRKAFIPHHMSHASAAFLPSPFEEAAILTVDGVGEQTTTALGTGRGSTISLTDEIRFPHSLGLLYSAVTAHLGFEVNEGEGKVMGLAPYGEPRMRAAFDEVLKVAPDGSFALDMSYFAFVEKLWMVSPRFEELFGPARRPDDPLEARHNDLAASLQLALEDALLKLGRALHAKSRLPRLCLAGGVALNCVANGRLLREGPFEEIYVQPAAGDDGGALGAALWGSCVLGGTPRPEPLRSAALGPRYADEDIAVVCRNFGLPARRLPPAQLVAETAKLLAEDRIVGWFQGRSEFGPRALGNRSILASPKRADMKDVLNARVKHREPFRPYAPVVPREHVSDYFELEADSPFMLIAAPVRPERRAEVPSITHVDGTARVQTVTAADGLYYDLVKEFGRRTGTPVLLDTSFNVKGEAMVNAPEDAIRCFLSTEIDALAIGDHLVLKSDCRPAARAARAGEKVQVP